ncbi:MAG: hypothetical protein L0H15_00535 [Nitrosospira sp.]|nr:hypothetical protein [Nitrosospira sp.]
MSNRYSIQGSEGEFEPRSRRRVLRNLLGIRSVREMAQLESEALYKATERAIDETQLSQHFDADDIRHIHRLLMGLQAGLPVLDFGGIRGEEKRRYIGASHAALEANYAPMTAIFKGVIARTLRSQARLTRA